MDFEEHRHHRRIMQQAFKRDRLVAYIEKANETIARVVPAWRPGAGFKLYEATKQLTLDIATEVFVGTEIGAQADRINRAFIDTVVGGQAIVRADRPSSTTPSSIDEDALLQHRRPHHAGRWPSRRPRRWDRDVLEQGGRDSARLERQ
jgi:cytochrome P450